MSESENLDLKWKQSRKKYYFSDIVFLALEKLSLYLQKMAFVHLTR